MKANSQQSAADGATSSDRSDSARGNGAEKMTEGSLDKVRDILFGAQIREHESKRIELAQQLQQQTDALQQEIAERFSASAQDAKKAQRELRDALKEEERGRERDIARLEKGMEKIAQTIIAHDAHNREVQTQLQERILAETRQLQAQLSARQDEATAKINELMAAMQDSKVGRQPLARFLSELAGRLEATPDSKD